MDKQPHLPIKQTKDVLDSQSAAAETVPEGAPWRARGGKHRDSSPR